MGALQPAHLILVLAIVLIIFGPGKLPQLGKAVGDGIRELKRATSDESGTGPARPEGAIATTVNSAIATNWSCPECHAQVPLTDRFCGMCGVAHEKSTRAATPSAAL